MEAVHKSTEIKPINYCKKKLTKRFMNITKFTKKLKEMDSQDIRLICGEMTAQEMRTSKAILKWVVSQLELPTTEQTIDAP